MMPNSYRPAKMQFRAEKKHQFLIEWGKKHHYDLSYYNENEIVKHCWNKYTNKFLTNRLNQCVYCYFLPRSVVQVAVVLEVVLEASPPEEVLQRRRYIPHT